MADTIYNFTICLNSSMTKADTILRSQLPSRISSEISLLIKSGIDLDSLTISCQKLQLLKAQNGKYDIDLLQQQVLLFDNDAEIYSFVQTEKELCTAASQFIQLPFALIKLAQRYLKKQQTFGSFLKLPENLEEYNSKQKLDQLETKCLQNLAEIKDRRKKLDSCVICWEGYASHIIQPCMHLVVCRDCINVKKCPLCKGSISQITNVFK